MGRLTRDPEIRYSKGEKPLAIARYTLAINRKFKKEEEPAADFISCVVFGKGAEFTEKYLYQGIRIIISGRLQTGSYINQEGQKIYVTQVVVEEQEFAESKSVRAQNERSELPSEADEFMNIPDDIEGLPFR